MKVVRTLSSAQKALIRNKGKVQCIHFYSYFDGTIVLCDIFGIEAGTSIIGNERYPVTIMDRTGNLGFGLTLGQVGTDRYKKFLAEAKLMAKAAECLAKVMCGR